jgi:LacI family gluconate utilization system Gnt-I transcriptional repressor
MNPPLTTVRTRRNDLGEAAAAMLLKLIRSEPVAANSIDIGYSLIIREST